MIPRLTFLQVTKLAQYCGTSSLEVSVIKKWRQHRKA